MKERSHKKETRLPRHGPCTRLCLLQSTPASSSSTLNSNYSQAQSPIPTASISSNSLSPSNLNIFQPCEHSSEAHTLRATKTTRRTISPIHQRDKHTNTKMTSRIPNPSAPRLSTAPSSIKPRQLVRLPFPIPDPLPYPTTRVLESK
jgi:hypothetical protein